MREAGADLDFKPHVILSFGRSVNSACYEESKPPKLTARAKQNSHWCAFFLCARQGQTLNLNKTNTEFFSDSVKKNSQHVLTKYPLVYKFSARAGTDLDFKPHVILSFGRSVILA